MDQIACARGLMQRVNVLRDGVNLAGMLALEPRQRDMRRVGPRIAMPPPAQIIEVVHTRWVAGKAFRRRHLLERELGPQSTFVAEGAESALGRQAGAGQDDDVVEGCHRTTGFSLDGNGTTIAGYGWAERLVLRG
jgi:hypothetical protein